MKATYLTCVRSVCQASAHGFPNPESVLVLWISRLQATLQHHHGRSPVAAFPPNTLTLHTGRIIH